MAFACVVYALEKLVLYNQKKQTEDCSVSRKRYKTEEKQ